MNLLEAVQEFTSKTPDELQQPPVKVNEAQGAQAKQEAPLEVEAKQETQSSDTKAEQKMYKVKVDGEELEVNEEELLKGYSRESHYQKKARNLSKEVEAIEARKAELDNAINDAQLVIDDELSKLESPEMMELKSDDPEAYLREVDRINAKVKKFNGLKSKREAELKANSEAKMQQERKALIDAFPEWSDPAVMQKEGTALLSVLGEYGFTENELSSLMDSRLFILANKVKQLDAIEKASLEAKEVKTKPKHAEAGGAESPKPNGKKADLERLGRTRNLKEAASIFANM